jgi:hypothetical protein
MKQHVVTVVTVGSCWRGKCSCREAGPIEEDHSDADRWGREHRKKIERIRLALERQPTLKQAAKLLDEAAANPELSEDARLLFTQMADEIRHRLHGPDNPPDQLALFDQAERGSRATPKRRKATYRPG